MVQVQAAAQDRDLGAVAADIRRVLAETAGDAAQGQPACSLVGQVQTMDRAFSGLFVGIGARWC